MLQYRNTPSRRDALSPAQKFYGHSVQDILPAHRRSFAKKWQLKAESAEQQVSNTSLASEKYYNQHAHTLPDIQVGSNVAIHNTKTKLWDIYGIVTHITPHRCYYIIMSRYQVAELVLISNRRFVRMSPCPNLYSTKHSTPADLTAITYTRTTTSPSPVNKM